jgi:HEAT repeat protein
MLSEAFEALKTYDWGTDLAVLAPIDDATAAVKNPQAGEDLEKQLLAALQGKLSRDAHDYVCRKLAIVGTAAAVPVLAPQLANKEHAHMARYALERINAPEAGRALRDSLGNLSGNLKIGVISSLGSRREAEAVEPLGALIRDSDADVARAATLALGTIGTAEAVGVLRSALQSGGAPHQAVIDALLSCAESLLAGNKQADAVAIYKSLSADSQPRLVRLAATRGLLACGAKQS